MTILTSQRSHFHKLHKNLNKSTKTRTTPTKQTPTNTMSKSTFYLLTIIFLHTHFTICHGVSVSGLNSVGKSGLDAVVSSKGGCSNKIGDCFEEAEMESEISRRVLIMQKKYISYETLKRDMVPCEKAGASYYDCHAGEANPYSRGCETITRCRGH